MTILKVAKTTEQEADFRQFLSYLFAQDSTGVASDGVLTGLVVEQTATPSGSVGVLPGAAVIQDSGISGGFPMINNSAFVLDVLGSNPVGGLPRNDLIVLDYATESVRAIIGTPNASPTDPSVPATAVRLARLRQIQSGQPNYGKIPAGQIDDLRVKTSLFGGATEDNKIRGVRFAGASATKVAKRLHWGFATVTPNSTGYATINHGADFTPSVVTATCVWTNTAVDPAQIDAVTFQVRILNTAAVSPGTPTKVMFVCGE